MFGDIITGQLNLALQAVVGLSRHYGRGLVTAHELAESEGIPEPSLRKVLPLLRRAGLVETERGMRGGHRLSRDPRDVTLLEVCDALDVHWSRNLCPVGTPCSRNPEQCPTVQELARIAGLLRQVLGKQSVSACCRGLKPPGPKDA
jgi:Rrf2 family protein